MVATAGDRRSAGRPCQQGTFTTEYCASNAENFEHEGEHVTLVQTSDAVDRESA
jgi:hypothetical protein